MAVVSANRSKGCRSVETNSPPFHVQFETAKLSKRRFSRASASRTKVTSSSRRASRSKGVMPIENADFFDSIGHEQTKSDRRIESATAPQADIGRGGWQVRSVPIVLQKSPRRGCRIKIRNNRIGAMGFLNQCCTLAPDLESILRARMRKIVLQHNLPTAAMPGRSVALRTRPEGSDKGEDTPANRYGSHDPSSVQAWAWTSKPRHSVPHSFGNMNSPSLQEGRGYSLGSPVLRRR